MTNKSKKIQTEISAGELLDKLSILEIKIVKIKNKSNLIEIKKDVDSYHPLNICWYSSLGNYSLFKTLSIRGN